jgi:hypothetical protein
MKIKTDMLVVLFHCHFVIISCNRDSSIGINKCVKGFKNTCESLKFLIPVENKCLLCDYDYLFSQKYARIYK